MTTQSFTGKINTNGEYQTLASLTSITFTSGKSYTINIDGSAYLKIADAEFPVNNERFPLTQGADDVYIKTGTLGINSIAVLENA